MKIQINAKVICDEKSCGKVSCVIIDPLNDELTHFVVSVEHFPLPHSEHLVSLKHVAKVDNDSVTLDCSPDDLSKMEGFIRHEFVPSGIVTSGYGSEHLRKPSMLMTQVDHEKVPKGELAVHAGAKVFTKKEQIGRVDDFLIESKDDGHITHIVMREGHLWMARNITIPISEIEKIDDEGVHLKLGKEEVEELPSLKIHGWFN
jgi:hypothetical protein